MKTKKFDTNAFLKKNSSRHHYIPKFLIDGFKNSSGLLYIYDKIQDKILKNPRPPKAIFFEEDRNTIELTESIESSIIEDFIFKLIDNDTSKVVNLYQNEELDKIKFTHDDNSTFLLFLITLYWRIPYTDYAANDVIDNAQFSATGIDPKLLQNNQAIRKVQRAGLFRHHLNEMINFGKKGKKWVNIHQSGNEIYVIGDNPLLFKKPQKQFSEFNEIDFLIALTSTRIYSSTNNKLENFNIHNSMLYNVSIINQSIRYIGCSNLETLKESVRIYTELKNKGLYQLIIEKTFDTNKK